LRRLRPDSAPTLNTFVRGPRLRARWDMSNTDFYRKLAEGKIPKPRYPFGGSTPYWLLAEIEEFEKAAAARPAAKIVSK